MREFVILVCSVVLFGASIYVVNRKPDSPTVLSESYLLPSGVTVICDPYSRALIYRAGDSGLTVVRLEGEETCQEVSPR